MLSEQTAFTANVEAFIYQNFGVGENSPAIPVDLSIFDRDAGSPAPKPSAPEVSVSEAEAKKRVSAAYDRGYSTGKAETLADAERKIAEAKQSVAANLKAFEQEREQYFRSMEGDIVKLALAIARKILHREAQVDRVVLAGVVRVALEKISGSTQVALCVHPSAAQVWRQYLAGPHNLANAPEIVEDASLQPDQVLLRTSHGSTSIGVDVQFAEIEKGFSDLVKQRQRSLQP